MSEMLFLFTFGPVQSFIAEARRGQDLFAGSDILSKLAASALQRMIDLGARAVYPLPLAPNIPNKLVLITSDTLAASLGKAAKEALLERWQLFVREARRAVDTWETAPAPDEKWESIWTRQTTDIWDCYWVAVPLGNNYGQTYQRANQLLDAAKRARPFKQSVEDGLKDTLCGRRSALRTKNLGAKDYWASVSLSVTAAKLRSGGRERLDALGCIKRFNGGVIKVPSVSSVASEDFLQAAKKSAPKELASYRTAVDALNVKTISHNEAWPYDGDLFYQETLTEKRLQDSYSLASVDKEALLQAQAQLKLLLKLVGKAPRTYYAILVLDGDDMGKRIDGCKCNAEHTQFSQRVNDFSAKVKEIVEGNDHYGALVYAGGDDVLALLPVSTVLDTAHQLAEQFKQLTDNHASAGIAITHYLSPLNIALQEARNAEHAAKSLEGKNAVAIHALKRSGEILQVRMKWDGVQTLQSTVQAIDSEVLSSKIAYDLRESARAFPTVSDGFKAEIRRLLARHKQKPSASDVKELDVKQMGEELARWATEIGDPMQFTDLLLLARFMTQGDME